ncbi:MAG: outer membrane protein assembly factor BamA [Deltaproteobacteria bacterium]|nr:outer membrane protein assembly factor BamA [Deltaproteobacteria bacterium]
MKLRHFFILSTLLLSFSPRALPGGELERIRSIEIQNSLPQRRKDILSIIRLKVGDTFDREKMDNSIFDLRKWGVFKNVEVLVRHEGNEVELTYQLEDAYIIKEVAIAGNYPLLEKRVRRAVFMSPGDVFEEEKIPEQIDRLIGFYEKEGFQNTIVYIQQYPNDNDRSITLKVVIEKGRGFRVREVNLEGNTVFHPGRIKNKISRFFDFKPRKIKSDIDSIVKLYKDAGYPRVRVKLSKTEFDKERRTVDLTLQIKEGKRVEVLFEGNAHQQSRKLQKIVSVTQSGDTDEFELEHSKALLLAHYRSLGYDETQVTYTKKELSPLHSLLVFKIEEGPKHLIKKIDFEGNEHFSDKTLKKQMLTKEESLGDSGVFLEELFKQDLENIEKFYETQGYLETKVEDWKKELNATQDKFLLNVELKERKIYPVESLEFEGLKSLKLEKVKGFLRVQENKPFSPTLLEEDVRALLVHYADQGYPYAEVKTEFDKLDSGKVKIRYKINEGKKAEMGQILLVGNNRTKSKSILQALKLKEGDPFRPQQILDSQIRLRRLGIFDSLSLETLGLKGKEEKVHLVVRVEERKNKILDLGFTYDTDTSFKAKLVYSELNLLGRAKHLDFKLTGGLLFNRGEIAYTDPRFLGSDWQQFANVFAQYENRASLEDRQVGTSLAFLRDLTRKLSLIFKYEFALTEFNEAKTDFSLLPPGSGTNTTGKLGVSVSYDKRDNFGDPHSGFYTVGKFDYGTQLNDGVTHFLKWGSRFGYWWSPFAKLTFANVLRVDNIIPLSSSGRVPAQELFFLGGDDTIRGFGQDQINPGGGKLALVHNLELQFRLYKGFQVVGFADSGFDINSWGELGLDTLRHSAGAGLRYVTPVGPIRLDYGFILDRRPEESKGRLHFTFGYFF